ncbi:MAG: hypothetical protein JXB36_17200, partial [Gammaproteobacteria bacterium]|nr:hypothetical protein [Gammaproteobacteria bacterium]
MLFKSRFHEGIRTGRITTTVRIWKRPHAKLGDGERVFVIDFHYDGSAPARPAPRALLAPPEKP